MWSCCGRAAQVRIGRSALFDFFVDQTDTVQDKKRLALFDGGTGRSDETGEPAGSNCTHFAAKLIPDAFNHALHSVRRAVENT